MVLAVAFGLLGMVVVLKGLAGKPAVDSGVPNPAPGAGTESASGSPTNEPIAHGSNGPVAVSEELRAALIAKELEQIQELAGEANGTNNPIIIAALVDKVVNPEAEVRKAALVALAQLNDTNAVPSLQQAAERVNDPRAKVAIMDTIDYLNLPDAMPAVQPPETFSNVPIVLPPASKMNPKFLHTNTANLRMQNSGQ